MTLNHDIEIARRKVEGALKALKEAQKDLEEATRALASLSLDAQLFDTPFAVPPKKPEPVPEPLPEIVINEEWAQALDLLHHHPGHLFVTGEAGTGKSTLLGKFQQDYQGSTAVVAPTGVAALRVGGETIHRFFMFSPHALGEEDIREITDSRKRRKYMALDTLIIDEISMVRADLMDAIDQFLRKNGRDKTLPFGGCRVIMFGDLFQLPPIAKTPEEKKWLKARYGTEMPFFFHAAVWRESPITTIELKTIYRQKDPHFTEALNSIRRGEVVQEMLDRINTTVNPGFRPTDGELWLTLCTTNYSVDQINQRMISRLPGAPQKYTATVIGDFDLKNAPTDVELNLKVGATVMFVRNDMDHHWVNGTLGKVVDLDPIRVQIGDMDYEVFPETWEEIRYTYDDKTGKLHKEVRGEFSQYPLKPAEAITIHKAQGMTFDRCIIDLGGGTFAAGQAYVALSRLRSLEGMVLRKPLMPRDLIVSTEVQAFMKGEAIAKPSTQMSLLESGGKS